MTIFFFHLWQNTKNKTPDIETAEKVFQHAVAGLFIQRYVMCGISDPQTYKILSKEPDDNLHNKLSSIQRVLIKWSYGEVFTQHEHYMMQFNDIIEQCTEARAELCKTFADGYLTGGNRSEQANVPKKVYDDSAKVYEEALVKYNVIAVRDYERL